MSLIIQNLRHLNHLTANLAPLLKPGHRLLLNGEMGAGKTTFTTSLCRQLGVTEAISSPTFTLVNRYEGAIPIYHLDLYRLHHPSSLLDMDIDYYLFSADTIVIIEWAEKLDYLYPDTFCELTFSHKSAHKRLLTIHSVGEDYAAFSEALSKPFA